MKEKKKSKLVKTTALTLLIAATLMLSGAVTGVTVNMNEKIATGEQGTSGEGDSAIGAPLEPMIAETDMGKVIPYSGSTRSTVVWDNDLSYVSMGSSQDDTQYPLLSEMADDFKFDFNQVVMDVHWVGGYWNGDLQAEFDWRVRFYEDAGGAPGALHAGPFLFPWSALTTIDLGGGYYEMSTDLPGPVMFNAGVKYWISVQGVGFFPPQSGFAMHSGVQLSEGMFKSAFFGYPDWTPASVVGWGYYDFCFQLTTKAEHDVGVTEIIHPTHGDSPGCPCIPVEVEVTNSGANDEFDVPVTVEIHRNLWTQTFGGDYPDEMPFIIDGQDCTFAPTPVETAFPGVITPFHGASFMELDQFMCLGVSYLTTAEPSDLTGDCLDPWFKFYFWHDEYGSDDYVDVEVSTDGVNFAYLGGPYYRLCCPDCPIGWTEYRLSLAAYIGGPVWIRFVGHCEMPLDAYNLGIDYACLFDLEYQETQEIDIAAGEVLNVEFPCWPGECWWCQYENEDVLFWVGAWTDMEGDEVPGNDGFGPLQSNFLPVWIHIPWTHDVGDKEISEPSQEFYMAGQPIEMCQIIKNYGKEPEGCFNVYMSIEEQYLLPGWEILPKEKFEGSFPPAGWTRTYLPPYYYTWERNDYYYTPNYAGGDGYCASQDSDWAYVGTAGELFTPSFSTVGATEPILEFMAAYNYIGGNEYFEVAVSENGMAGPFTQELLWQEDHSAYGPGEFVQIDLSAYANEPDVVVRFTYDDTGVWAWWICLDDVRVYTESSAAYYDPFYLDQVCVDDIQVCEELEVCFEDWIPQPPEPCFCGQVTYRIKSWTKMLDPQDQNAANDMQEKLVTVEFLHDVALVEFTSPPKEIDIGGTVIFSQLPIPDDSTGHGPFSDAGQSEYRCYENFWGLTDDIDDVHWWGLWGFGSGSPTAGDTFEISFCADNGGIPDHNNHLYDFTGALGTDITYTGTGVFYWGYELYYMEMDLPSSVSMAEGWVSFYKTTINSQVFACIDALTGDGLAYQKNVASPVLTYDLAFELTTEGNGGGGEEYPDPDLYIPCGEQDFCVKVANLGTYDEVPSVVWSFYQYTPAKELIDSGSVDVAIAAGAEEEVCLFTYTFDEEGIYEIEVEVVSATDCNLDNNGPEALIVGVDCCGPESCFVLDPEEPNGENNWFTSKVTVSAYAWEDDCLVHSGIAKIVYIIDGAEDYIPGDSGTFTIDGDGVHFIELYAVDNVGNEEDEHHTFEVAIDETKPDVELIFDYYDDGGTMMVDFTAIAGDATSGIQSVEFFLDGGLEFTDNSFPYEWTIEWDAAYVDSTFKATATDGAGNSDSAEVDGEDISYEPNYQTQQQTTQQQQQSSQQQWHTVRTVGSR